MDEFEVRADFLRSVHEERLNRNPCTVFVAAFPWPELPGQERTGLTGEVRFQNDF